MGERCETVRMIMGLEMGISLIMDDNYVTFSEEEEEEE